MEHAISPSYPIAPQYEKRLGGLLMLNALPINSIIRFTQHDYLVEHCYPVTLRLYVTSGIVRIYQGDYSLSGTAQIKRFANIIGLMDQKSLIQSFFRNCSIIDNYATCCMHFVSFTEENIFRSWNA